MQCQGQLLQQPEEKFPGEVQGEEDCDGPGQEKQLHLTQLQQDGGPPAGNVQAVLLPVYQPPSAGAAMSLSDVSFSDTNLLSAPLFG